MRIQIFGVEYEVRKNRNTITFNPRCTPSITVTILIACLTTLLFRAIFTHSLYKVYLLKINIYCQPKTRLRVRNNQMVT
jgi:hypothetical protein